MNNSIALEQILGSLAKDDKKNWAIFMCHIVCAMDHQTRHDL